MSKDPAYRRHKPSGQAVVTLNGRDIYLGPYGSQASRREYDRLVGEWLVDAFRQALRPLRGLYGRTPAVSFGAAESQP